MKLDKYFDNSNEKPLENIPLDGGLSGIFRKIGCIGDSLASGEFESEKESGERDFHDCYEYSWGQYLGRQIGATVYNLSRGGMTAEEYWNTFAEANHFWENDKLCQAYIIALGVNDLFGSSIHVGSVDDINLNDYMQNKKTFAGYYGCIIQKLKQMQPKAKFFLMTMPRENDVEHDKKARVHQKLIYDISEKFDDIYVIDFTEYAPIYDEKFKTLFYLGGHMNPAGYLLTARMIAAYIDYIIRHNMKDFSQVGFIGTDFYNCTIRR